MWRAMVWACNDKENAVIDSLKKVYQWRSTRWWYAPHTRMMKEDPENRTRWKHKWWLAQSRECVGHNGYTLGRRERLDDKTKRAYLFE